MVPDYEGIDQKINDMIHRFNRGIDVREDFKEIYALLGVVRVSVLLAYEKDPSSRLIVPEFVVEDEMAEDGSITLFESSSEYGEFMEFVYPKPDGNEAAVKWYLAKRISKSLLDEERYQRAADKLFLIQSVKNLRRMLDFARNHDPLSGIPNGMGIRRLYKEALKENPEVDYAVLYINLQNFKYFNERLGSRGGDEVIIQYSRRLTLLVAPDEGVCRLGGDNFLMFVRPENLDGLINKLSSFTVTLS